MKLPPSCWLPHNWSSSKSRRRADWELPHPGMHMSKDDGPISCCSGVVSRRAFKSLLLPGAKAAGMVPGRLRRRLCATLALLAVVRIFSPAWYRQYCAPDIATDYSDSDDGALGEECDGKRVFMYDLPARFNRGVLERCSGEMVDWLNFCPYGMNNGFGKLLDFQSGTVPSNSSLYSDFFTRRVTPAPEVWDASSIRQQVLGEGHGFVPDEDSCKEAKGGSWFATDAYMLEQIYHRRMMHYPCLTTKPELASAFFLPYYSGLDALQYLYGEKRGRGHEHGEELIAFLEGNAGMRPFWKRNGGRDHFMVAGRTGWDFGQALESRDGWGTGLFAQPALENVTFLVLEGRGWRQGFEQAVPYPTSFHPPLVRKRWASKLKVQSQDGFGKQELREWMRKVKTARRTSLFAFAGAMRPGMASSIRSILHRQCLDANSNTSKLRSASESESALLLLHRRFNPVCATVDCESVKCSHNPQPAMDTFLHSEFCLQPTGDTATRRSTFDSIVAGCIPVFFHPDSAYTQYTWHLPEEASSYSVYIPEESIREGTTVEEVLRRFSEEEVQQLRAALIRLLPRVIYMDLEEDSSSLEEDSSSSSSRCAASHRNSRSLASSAHQRAMYMEAVHVEDAFDVSVKGILAKIPSQTP